MIEVSSHLFDEVPETVANRFFSYFYTKSSKPGKNPSLRRRAIALYDPFADRTKFPAGIRYCCNVFTGCDHKCEYCYAANYIRDHLHGRIKEDFPEQLGKDIKAIRDLDLNPTPIHISNSTDALQERLEKTYRHTHLLLKTVVENGHYFSITTILTKNPSMLLDRDCDYISIIKSIPRFQIEVSLTFWNDGCRQFYEPGAPTVQSRLDAIRALRQKEIAVSLRIDPLFPRDPISNDTTGKKLLDYGFHTAQTIEDLHHLIDFAAETGCQKVIVSPCKVPIGRFRNVDYMNQCRNFYTAIGLSRKPITKGFAWRLPREYYEHQILAPVQEYCNLKNISLMDCKQNLITTV